MSAVRGLILSEPQRLEEVRALASARDVRFGGLSVRPFALKGGLDLCPPGAAFVASIEACPDLFLDTVFLDPKLNGSQGARLARCLAPGAESFGGIVPPSAPALDLDGWLSMRADYVAQLLERSSKPDSWIASTASLDDLVLEAIDAHADRLFGQRRRKTLETPGFAVPAGSAWRAIGEPPEGALASLRREQPSFWSRILGQNPPALPAPATASLVAALKDGVRQGRQVAASLVEGKGPLRFNVLAESDAAAFAMGVAHGLGGRDASARDTLVRVVDRSSARLGAFMLLYRELRFFCRGRVVFRWCPAPEPLPPAEWTFRKRGKAWEIDPAPAAP